MDQKRLQELRSRIERHPANVLDRFVLAKMYHDEGLWDETVLECQEILKLKPDYLVVCIMLGESLIRKNQNLDARKILEKAKDLAVTQKHMGMIPGIEDLLDEIS